jgi:hypothetical protein
MLTATDPAEVQQLSREINDLFNQTFDLLSPEDRITRQVLPLALSQPAS